MRVLLFLIFVPLYSYQPFIIKYYDKTIPHHEECYIGADLGGTNMDFGIFLLKDDKPQLLFSLHTKTKTITDFTRVVNDVISYAHNEHALSIYKACIALPGTPKKNWKLYTFHPSCYYFDVSVDDLISNTSLTTVLLVSDSAVIGYGLDYIHKDDIIPLVDNYRHDYEHWATMNIGTGCGSTFYSWDSGLQRYISHHSRASRMEFVPLNQDEFDMAHYIKEIKGNSVVWSNLVSGTGIKNIYAALKSTNKYQDALHLNDYNAEVIFAHQEDELCAETVVWFFRFLIRCVRNYAAATFPLGGLYIAGGVISKNAKHIASLFALEYAIDDISLEEIIHSVPVYMVTDYDVSLYGAMHCLLVHCLV